MKAKLLCAIAILLTGLYLFPVYWMYLTAFKSSAGIFQFPPTFWPSDPQFDFLAIWQDHAMASYLWNSLVIASGATAIVVALGTGCAYVLGRLRNRWIDATLLLVLMMQVLPTSLMVTPIFVIFQQFGLLDMPRLSVVLAQAAKMLPLYIVLCRASFVQLPGELEAAAMVDGSSRIGAFFSVALPLARNGILVATLLVFLQSFGEYVYSVSLIQQQSLQPASVGLQTFMGPNTNDWSGVMTYTAIYVTPVLLIFVLLQKRIVSGLTAGAIK